MLRPGLLFLLFSLASTLTAQFESPIAWDFDYEYVEGDTYDLRITATAEKGWSLYSQFTPEGGPVPTAFYWEDGEHYERIGRAEETGHLKTVMDELFGVDVHKFLSDEPVVFTQRIRVVNYEVPIEGAVEYMCCDDEQCLPPTDEPFSYTLPKPGPGRGAVTPAQTRTLTEADVEVMNDEAVPGRGSAAEVGLPRIVPSPPASAPSESSEKVIAAKPVTDGMREELSTAAPLPQERVYETSTVAQPAPSEQNPISWTLSAEALDGERYRISMLGTIAEGWTTYSQTVDPMTGPIPTELVFEAGQPEAEPTETSATLKTGYDAVWDDEITKIVGGTVTYSQVVYAPAGEEIRGLLSYQTCDDEICLPPVDLEFSVTTVNGVPVATLDGVAAGSGAVASSSTTDTPLLGQDELGIPVNFDPVPLADCSEGEEATEDQSLLGIFGLGLLGGLFALIMPCIFPMIPLTVSFFTKKESSRAEGIKQASLYGFFIFLIYVLLSVPFHVLDGLGASVLNDIASNVWLNLTFFLVFLYFAGSFFGFYEIQLPERWSNRASRAEGTGGAVGIFFMALTLALVSFSCTGPLLGTLLVQAVSQGAWPLTAGMAGFGVALGMPFALFAAFPGFLNSLPKSGGWLNSVKVVLGFAEVALAFKFLSNADLIGNWEVLRFEPFMLIWILCALGIAAYLFGFISFPHDSSKRKVGTVGAVVAAASVAFALYLGYSFVPDPQTETYRPRSVMSGLAPPVCYNFLQPCDEDLNITPFKDLEKGLAYAREVGKPVMLDFTGESCVNCRKMEENVWTEPSIRGLLKDDYVIVSLYVDARDALPEDQFREVVRLDGSGRTKLIDQVGEKWQYFEQAVYNRASQPYYVLVSPDGKTLNAPVAFTEAATYEEFLRCGLATYRNLAEASK